MPCIADKAELFRLRNHPGGQIIVANRGKRFLNSGDSGSLMVENVSTNPRAVGLLYAGSSSSAIANPIGEVLNLLSTKLGTTTMGAGTSMWGSMRSSKGPEMRPK